MRALPPWPYPPFVAHRGGGTLAPENTLAGMRMAKNYGYEMVEFDVKLSQDGIVILLHDTLLERTTNGSGAAASYPYSALTQFDAGSWHSADFAGEPIPRLDAISRYLLNQAIACNIEIKPNPGQEALTGSIVGQLTAQLWSTQSLSKAQAVAAGQHKNRQTAAVSLPIFSSFSFDALKAAYQVAPQFPRGFLSTALPQNWQEILISLDCVSLHLSHKHITKSVVEMVRNAGWRVGVWTVNDPVLARQLLSWGVDSVFTDVLDLIEPGTNTQNKEAGHV